MRKKIYAPTLYPINRDLSKTWFVKHTDSTGRPIKKYGNLNNLPTIRERLKEAEKIINGLAITNVVTHKKDNDFIALLYSLLEYKKPMIEPTTYTSFEIIIKAFGIWYRKEECNKISENVTINFIRYMHERGLHKNTIRNRIMVLRGLANELVEQKKIPANPLEKVKLKKIKPQSKLPFHRQQVIELLPIVEKEDKQLRDAIDFLYYLYFRPKEVRALKVKHILFEQMKIIATDDVLKDDDNYLKAIPIPMQQHILKYKGLPSEYYIFSASGSAGTKQLCRDILCRRMTRILRKLNYSNRYTLYSWVHTGIKDAAMSGIPIKQLQLQKGHHDLNMFNEYLKDLGVDDCLQLINNFPAL